MSLNSGGHITHGLKISMSGKWFNPIGYDVDKESELIDYDYVEKLALEHKPKLIIAGGRNSNGAQITDITFQCKHCNTFMGQDVII